MSAKIVKLLLLTLLSSPAIAGTITTVCGEGHFVCFANGYSGDKLQVSWLPPGSEVGVADPTAYEVRLARTDGSFDALGRASGLSFIYTVVKSGTTFIQVRSVGICEGGEECYSPWASTDNPEDTQDGMPWLLVASPAPPTATFK